jgi:outer membrane protein OmpA-like peptidoglycan-associated protein
MDTTPTFRVTVVSRTARAINYQHRGGATKLNFAGTELMPKATGEAKVESKQGYIEIEVKFDELQKSTTFGNEYLTYILWAISPEGRAVNLGEVLLNGNRSKLDVTTDLQAFALIVTAEPYYAVRQPSNVVVLENVIREDTKGTTQPVNAKYDVLDRGGYIPDGYRFDPVVINAKLPLEFFEARNAVRIAQSEGADKYASDSYQRAVQLMDRADALATRKNVEKKPLIAAARAAVQTAEDARAIAVTRIDEERQANERKASADAQARSQAQADDATRQKELAETDARKAQAAKSQAQSDAAKAESDRALAESAAIQAKVDMASNQAVSDAALATTQANMASNQAASDAALATAKSDMASNQAASAAALATAQADADRAKRSAQESEQRAQQADADKTAMRARLSEQLNSILQTRDSARGLIVSMSDVVFDTGRYSLKPGAREKLAKISGILLAYPGLNVDVDGFTDSVGSDTSNQLLSENRATSVRDYLVSQGVSAGSITAKGLGNSQPVATNDNAAGRQMNRRVELVVSGEAIGTPVAVSTGSLR